MATTMRMTMSMTMSGMPASVAMVMLIVVSMVAYILFEGISTLFQPGFLTEPSRANGTQGGVLYQLFDSFYLLLITLIISVPISLGGSVFLVEYAPDGPIRDIASTAIETLSSLPSIVEVRSMMHQKYKFNKGEAYVQFI